MLVNPAVPPQLPTQIATAVDLSSDARGQEGLHTPRNHSRLVLRLLKIHLCLLFDIQGFILSLNFETDSIVAILCSHFLQFFFACPDAQLLWTRIVHLSAFQLFLSLHNLIWICRATTLSAALPLEPSGCARLGPFGMKILISLHVPWPGHLPRTSGRISFCPDGLENLSERYCTCQTDFWSQKAALDSTCQASPFLLRVFTQPFK